MKKINLEEKKYVFAVTLLIIYLVVGQLVYFFVLNSQIKTDVIEQIDTFLQAQTKNIENIIDLQFTNLSVDADVLSQNDDLFCDENKVAITKIARNALFESIMIIDSEGNGIKHDGQKTNVSNRDYFKKAIKGGKVITAPLDSTVDDGYRIIMAVPIRKNGSVVGVFCGDFALNKLNKMIFSNGLYNNKGNFFILDNDATVISSDNPAFKNDEKQMNFFDNYTNLKFHGACSENEIKSRFRMNKIGSCQFEYNNKERYFAYAPLKYNSWNMCYMVSSEYVNMQTNHVKIDSYILFAASLLGVLMLFFCIKHQYSRSTKLLKKKAKIDALTGLLNKAETEIQIKEHLEKSKNESLLCMIDLDGFKNINDNLGHQIGDIVLKRVGEIMRNTFRNTDIIGRVGGDEFIVFLADVKNINVVEEKINELSKKIVQFIKSEFNIEKIGCSCGIAYCPKHGQTFEVLYKKADEAMYQAKREGKSNCKIYNEKTGE